MFYRALSLGFKFIALLILIGIWVRPQPQSQPQAPTTPTPSPTQLTSAQIRQVAETELLRRMVQIRTRNGMGSGALISSDGLILTNAHVVGRASEVKVIFAKNITLTGKVIKRVAPPPQPLNQPLLATYQPDFALVKVEAKDLPYFKVESAQPGKTYCAIGNPCDPNAPKISCGQIINQRYDGKVIESNATIYPGNSGGPIASEDDPTTLIGLVTWGKSQKKQGEERPKCEPLLAGAQSASAIQSFINSQ